MFTEKKESLRESERERERKKKRMHVCCMMVNVLFRPSFECTCSPKDWVLLVSSEPGQLFICIGLAHLFIGPKVMGSGMLLGTVPSPALLICLFRVSPMRDAGASHVLSKCEDSTRTKRG